MTPSFIDLPGNRRIAYHLSEGALPGIVFLGGFRSDMTGSKAMALEAFCRERGRRFLRFDYTGHGQSSGAFKDGCISDWKQDALDMLDNMAPGKNILVGSSMGAWLMLLAAFARPQNVVALTGIASASDFTEDLVWDIFTDAQKKQLLEEGAVPIPDCYGTEPYHITRRLIEDGRRHLLLNSNIVIPAKAGISASAVKMDDREIPASARMTKIPLTVPIRLIHGAADADVPWQTSVTLMERLASPDIRLTLIKGGNHRLSEPAHLAVICGIVEDLTIG